MIINDGSHLAVAFDHTLQHVYGDGRSMIHVIHNTTLDIDGDMTAHAHIHEHSSMNFNADVLVTLISSIHVSGQINLTRPVNQSFVLDSPASLTIDSVSMNRINCKKLEIKEKATMNIADETVLFHLETNEIKVDGNFFAKSLKIYDIIKKFFVGYKGVVEFDPISSDMYIGPYIDIRGRVNIRKYVSIVQPCKQFLLETGTLTWPATSDIIIMECDLVKINSDFSPGIISFGTGVDQFSVHTQGNFVFTADGSVLVNSVSIAGKMYVNNIATLESHNAIDGHIKSFHIHYPAGQLVLSSQNLPAQTNATMINQTCNVLKTKQLTIDKLFNAGDLEIHNGIDEIFVNTHGSWTFGPCKTFNINELYVNGTVTSSYPLSLQGMSREKVQTIHIDTGGNVALSPYAQNTQAFTNVSVIGVHNISIDGTLTVALLKNYIKSNEGWDRLNIFEKGSFYFRAEGPMMIDYLYVNGHFESRGVVHMNGSDADLIVHIGSKGTVTFDSQTSSDWDDESRVTSSRIQMDSGSIWQSRNTEWVVDEADIFGKLYSHPSSDATFLDFNIKNGGLVDFSRTSVIKGKTLNIDKGGTFDIEYQHVPADTNRGVSESKLLYNTIDVDGMLKAGAIYIGHLDDIVERLDQVSVSGTIDVSGGGYIYDTGPGKIYY